MPAQVALSCVDTNGLTGLEVASSVLTGRESAADPPEARFASSARAAFERSLLRALRRPPCLVGFSGGRDSSALLGVATHVARREGLAEPVPVTIRFAGASQAAEQEWQELVVRRLALSDWTRRELSDELDLVGPVATEVMAREGLPYPYNLHLLAPLIDLAGGGSFVSGLGGDQALSLGGRALDVLALRVRPVARDVLRVAAGVAPRRLRRAALRSRVGLSFPWLRQQANALLSAAWLEHQLSQPFRWDQRLHELWRSRFMRVTLRRIASLAAHAGVTVHHPFAEADVVFALAREGGATGFGSRTAAMDVLFGDVLPAETISRATKASFDEVLFNRHTRSFLEGLGPGMLEQALASLELDTLVDPDALRAHWTGAAPMANSFLLLQACWLALQPRSTA